MRIYYYLSTNNKFPISICNIKNLMNKKMFSTLHINLNTDCAYFMEWKNTFFNIYGHVHTPSYNDTCTRTTSSDPKHKQAHTKDNQLLFCYYMEKNTKAKIYKYTGLVERESRIKAWTRNGCIWGCRIVVCHWVVHPFQTFSLVFFFIIIIICVLEYFQPLPFICSHSFEAMLTSELKYMLVIVISTVPYVHEFSLFRKIIFQNFVYLLYDVFPLFSFAFSPGLFYLTVLAVNSKSTTHFPQTRGCSTSYSRCFVMNSM